MGYKLRVSARAIIIHNDKILLNEFGDGVYYNFVGGGIEQYETARQAVIRGFLEYLDRYTGLSAGIDCSKDGKCNITKKIILFIFTIYFKSQI